MFSNDKNIESIAQLAELFKHYIGLQTQYIKLDVIEKIVRLFTVITLAIVLALTIVLVLIFLSFFLKNKKPGISFRAANVINLIQVNIEYRQGANSCSQTPRPIQPADYTFDNTYTCSFCASSI